MAAALGRAAGGRPAAARLRAPAGDRSACWCGGARPGPALFRQQRLGRGGAPFTLFKLRTMRQAAAGAAGSYVTAGGDPRITPLGRFLRRSKLDELPQLWNIVRGDLSFVGPRPEVPAWIELGDPRWQRVLAARPGLTDPVTLRLRNEEALLAAVPGDREDFYRDHLQPWKLAGYADYLARRSAAGDLGARLAHPGGRFRSAAGAGAHSRRDRGGLASSREDVAARTGSPARQNAGRIAHFGDRSRLAGLARELRSWWVTGGIPPEDSCSRTNSSATPSSAAPPCCCPCRSPPRAAEAQAANEAPSIRGQFGEAVEVSEVLLDVLVTDTPGQRGGRPRARRLRDRGEGQAAAAHRRFLLQQPLPPARPEDRRRGQAAPRARCRPTATSSSSSTTSAGSTTRAAGSSATSSTPAARPSAGSRPRCSRATGWRSSATTSSSRSTATSRATARIWRRRSTAPARAAIRAPNGPRAVRPWPKACPPSCATCPAARSSRRPASTCTTP